MLLLCLAGRAALWVPLPVSVCRQCEVHIVTAGGYSECFFSVSLKGAGLTERGLLTNYWHWEHKANMGITNLANIGSG